MKEYDLYLFDADGTLIDTGELVYQCYKATVEHYGRGSVSREDVKRYMGIPLDRMLGKLIPAMDDDDLAGVRSFYVDHQRRIYPDYLALFPGVGDVLAAFSGAGKTLGVVTSRHQPSIGLYLETLGIAPYFDLVVTPEQTREHKPHPEPVLYAMEKADRMAGKVFSPERTLFVGDAEFDIRSGNEAGVDTALVLWGHNGPEDIESVPTFLLNSMEDLINRP